MAAGFRPMPSRPSLTIDEATEYLRWRTYLLGRHRYNPEALAAHNTSVEFVFKTQESVAAEISLGFVGEGVRSALPEDQCLAEKQRFCGLSSERRVKIPQLAKGGGPLARVHFTESGRGHRQEPRSRLV